MKPKVLYNKHFLIYNVINKQINIKQINIKQINQYI